MSDGPHRSLPMSRGWKQLARRAANKAFSPVEVRDALPAALQQDWRGEVPERLCKLVQNVLNDNQGSLFEDQRVHGLEALRRETAGRTLGKAYLDYAIQAVMHGLGGKDAIAQAAANAIGDRAARGARQVEEHYLRKSTHARASHVRERIESGVIQSDFAAIAGRLVGIDTSDQPLAPVKNTALDDGVRL